MRSDRRSSTNGREGARPHHEDDHRHGRSRPFRVAWRRSSVGAYHDRLCKVSRSGWGRHWVSRPLSYVRTGHPVPGATASCAEALPPAHERHRPTAHSDHAKRTGSTPSPSVIHSTRSPMPRWPTPKRWTTSSRPARPGRARKSPRALSRSATQLMPWARRSGRARRRSRSTWDGDHTGFFHTTIHGHGRISP